MIAGIIESSRRRIGNGVYGLERLFNFGNNSLTDIEQLITDIQQNADRAAEIKRYLDKGKAYLSKFTSNLSKIRKYLLRQVELEKSDLVRSVLSLEVAYKGRYKNGVNKRLDDQARDCYHLLILLGSQAEMPMQKIEEHGLLRESLTALESALKSPEYEKSMNYFLAIYSLAKSAYHHVEKRTKKKGTVKNMIPGGVKEFFRDILPTNNLEKTLGHAEESYEKGRRLGDVPIEERSRYFGQACYHQLYALALKSGLKDNNLKMEQNLYDMSEKARNHDSALIQLITLYSLMLTIHKKQYINEKLST
ncbi:MAG: hypothetical protein ABIJ08_06555 [Nanoarchaeota archaeon]